MLIKLRSSLTLGFGLLALQCCLAQAQQQPNEASSTVQASSNGASGSLTTISTPAPALTTIISTITTTLSSGQSLPTSLSASASFKRQRILHSCDHGCAVDIDRSVDDCIFASSGIHRHAECHSVGSIFR